MTELKDFILINKKIISIVAILLLLFYFKSIFTFFITLFILAIFAIIVLLIVSDVLGVRDDLVGFIFFKIKQNKQL